MRGQGDSASLHQPLTDLSDSHGILPHRELLDQQPAFQPRVFCLAYSAKPYAQNS